MFALFRVYHVAYILPINITVVKKYEKELGKFMWTASGKVLRVSLEEIKNCPEMGGMDLPCVKSKSNALLLSQMLRLLRSNDRKSTSQVGYWIGELLGDLVQGIDGGVHANDAPAYLDHFSHLVVEARSFDLITLCNWKTLTSKAIYMHAALLPYTIILFYTI